MTPYRPTPLLGYNTSVLHGGVTYHIQTEDSGVEYAHVITQVFDAGRILAKLKTSYAPFIEAPNRAEIVRALIREQHRTVFATLREGRYDGAARRSGGESGASAPREDPPLDVGALAQSLAESRSSRARDEDARPGPRESGTGVPVERPAENAPSSARAARLSVAESLFGADLARGESIDEVIIDHLTLYLDESG